VLASVAFRPNLLHDRNEKFEVALAYQKRALAARKEEPFSTTTSNAPCLQLRPGETGWGERAAIALDPG
jgi:hypothetical protein